MQEQDAEEQQYEEQQYEESFVDYTREGGKKVYYIVGYFLLVAILVYPATKLHIGMTGILSAMAGAGIVLGLIWWCIRGIKRWIASLNMSKGEWARFLWGYRSEIVEAEGEAIPVFASPSPTLFLEKPTDRSLATLTSVLRSDDTLPDRIIESQGLYLSDAYQPGVNSVLGATLLYCGIRRAGKSNGMAATIEELARYLVPMLICDTDDEYGSLVDRKYLPRGVMAGSMHLLETAGEQLPHYIPIDLNGAFEFGQSIPEGLLQVVLNLRSFESDDEAALIICEIIAGMHAWEVGRPNSNRLPCMVFLDEANKWLPQQMGESSLSKDVQHELHKAIFGTMVRRGGKQGLGLAVSTQRISELDKRALQSNFKFLFMQTEQVDIERYMALGLDKGDILTLQQGECFVFSPQAIGFKVMWRSRTSPHMAHTPGLNQLLVARLRMQALETWTSRRYVTDLSVSTVKQEGETVSLPDTPRQRGADRDSFPVAVQVDPGSGKTLSKAPYPDGELAYASYLYTIDWLTPNAIRRVPDPLVDLANSLGLNPVRGRDRMNYRRASSIMDYVKALSPDKRAHYVALARPYAPAKPPRPREGVRAMGPAPPENTTGWRLPTSAVLHPPDHTHAAKVPEETLEEMRKIVQATLTEQRVEADVERDDISVGPRVIRVGIRPRRYPELVSDGKGGKIARRDGEGNDLYRKTKVSEIEKVAKDLTLALAAKSLRMQAPVPEKNYVGIEIPNPVPSFVTFYEVWSSAIYQQAVRTSRLSIAMGKDIAGHVRAGSFEPHLLVAGMTGSGKSVGIMTIIGSLLMQATPEDVCLVMVDPKMVEFTKYADIPHLLAPVITEVEQVKPLLQRLILEMESRYRLFAAAQVRNLEEYEKKRAATPSPGLKRLPVIIVIIDELADLMMSGPKGEMESLICRLAQKARAAGIHLVLGTQRPTVDVVTGTLKANMPVRIAYRVTSGTDARTIMDEGGADLLLGKGDLLYLTPEAGGAERLQGTLLSDAEIDAIVAHWKREGKRMQANGAWTGPYALPENAVQLSYVSDAAVPEREATPASTPRQAITGGEDALLTQVIADLANHDVVAVDMLKRGEFSPTIPGMGHDRACTIRDALLARDLIGPYSAGKKGHPVLVADQDASQKEMTSQEGAARP